jgi:hypothetical protein
MRDEDLWMNHTALRYALEGAAVVERWEQLGPRRRPYPPVHEDNHGLGLPNKPLSFSPSDLAADPRPRADRSRTAYPWPLYRQKGLGKPGTPALLL